MRSIRLLAALPAVVLGFFAVAPAEAATIQITEWMYNPAGTGGEFIEFTNMSNAAIDMTGWSFDDNDSAQGLVSLSAFGVLAAGESVILTEISAALFRTQWNLGANVKVIGSNTQNLGRSDAINLYNATNTLVDSLVYNDQGTGNVKSPRTQGISGRPGSASVIGANNASQWVLSVAGDVEGSYASTAGDLGSPGKTSFAPAPVPVPAAAWLMLSGLGTLGAALKRRRQTA